MSERAQTSKNKKRVKEMLKRNLIFAEKFVPEIAIGYTKLTAMEKYLSLEKIKKKFDLDTSRSNSNDEPLIETILAIVSYNLEFASRSDIVSQELPEFGEVSPLNPEIFYPKVVSMWAEIEKFLQENKRKDLSFIAGLLKELDSANYDVVREEYDKGLSRLKLVEGNIKIGYGEDIALAFYLKTLKGIAECYEGMEKWDKTAEYWLKLYCFVTDYRLGAIAMRRYFVAFSNVDHSAKLSKESKRKLQFCLQSYLRHSRNPISAVHSYGGVQYEVQHKMFVSIYLTPEFWKLLFNAALSTFDRRQVTRFMGYGEGVNIHFIKNRLIEGACGLPILKLKILCELTGVSIDEVEKHVVLIRPRSELAADYLGL